MVVKSPDPSKEIIIAAMEEVDDELKGKTYWKL